MAFDSNCWKCCLVAVGLQLLPSCNSSADPLGGQTGDGSDLDVDPPELPGPEQGEDQDEFAIAGVAVLDCNTDSQPIDDPDEQVDAVGFAPSELLQLLTEPYETSVLWGTSGEADVGPRASVGPETGVSGLQLTFSYQGGAVNLLTAAEGTQADAGASRSGESSSGESSSGASSSGASSSGASSSGPSSSGGDVASTSPASLPCPPEVEIEVQLQIRSDGGALDETVTTTLRARSTESATFSAEIDAAQLSGELMLTGESASDWPLSRVVVSGVIAEYGTSGTINIARVSDEPSVSDDSSVDPEGTSMSHEAVAVWPAPGECVDSGYGFGGGGGIVVDDDQELGEFSASDARTVFDGVMQLPVTWNEMEKSQLAVVVDASGPVCVWPDGGGGSAVAFPASVELASEDERIDGRYQATVDVIPGAKREMALASLSISLEESDPAEAAQHFGISDDISFEGFNSATLYISLTRELMTDALSGTVTVYGYKRAECDGNLPPSDRGEDEVFAVSPCEYSEQEMVLTGIIGETFETKVVQSEEASQTSLPRPEP